MRNVGKKIILEEVEESKRESKSFTASHIMLYIILGVYIAVSLAGLVFMGICIGTEKYEYIAQVFISEVSMVTGCSGVCVGFYATKATKENEIKLSNDKYRMRLEIAKDIFKEYGNTLDDKSIDLLRKLMSDKDISGIPPVSEQVQPVWQDNVVQRDFDPTNITNNDSEEGLG